MEATHPARYVLRLHDAEGTERAHLFVVDTYGLPPPGLEMSFGIGEQELRCTVSRWGIRHGTIEQETRGLHQGKIRENQSVHATVSDESAPLLDKLSAHESKDQKQARHIRIRTSHR